jgi:hypothetical protein
MTIKVWLDEAENITEKQWDKLSPNTEEWIDGIPPAGRECIAKSHGGRENRILVKYSGESFVVGIDVEGKERIYMLAHFTFNPFETAEELEREEAVKEMRRVGLASLTYEKIYDLGYRKIKELTDEEIGSIASYTEHPDCSEYWMRGTRDYMLDKEKS